MKKKILLSALISAAILTAGTVKAQYYNGGNAVYAHGYNGYDRAGVNRQSAYNYNGGYQVSEKYRDIDRINWLKIAMKEEANCGNWDAYRAHEEDLRQMYAAVERERFEAQRQSEVWRAEHGYYSERRY